VDLFQESKMWFDAECNNYRFLPGCFCPVDGGLALIFAFCSCDLSRRFAFDSACIICHGRIFDSDCNQDDADGLCNFGPCLMDAAMRLFGALLLVSNHQIFIPYTIEGHVEAGNVMILLSLIMALVAFPAFVINRSLGYELKNQQNIG
jgi:hypothetical protein